MARPLKSEKQDTARGIQSVEVVGQILSCLLDMDRPARLTDLAKASGVSPAKLHRYLISLRRIGLIGQDSASGLYDLGTLARRIAAECIDGKVADVAVPYMHDLSRQLRETVFLAELGGEGPISIRTAIPNLSVAITPRLGSVHGLTTSATGRIFAAFLAPEMREALLRRELHDLSSNKMKTETTRIEKKLQAVRKLGVDASHGERIAGINALSAPIFDGSGQIVLAITVVGNAATFPAQIDSDHARKLRETAAVISRRIAEPPA